jgi:hypothetical protein
MSWRITKVDNAHNHVLNTA